MRRIIKRADRTEDTKEGELRALDASKARSKPLSAYSRKVLREDNNSKNPTPGLSDFSRSKHEKSPKIANLPKDPEKARLLAYTEYRAIPTPNPYWEATQQH